MKALLAALLFASLTGCNAGGGGPQGESSYPSVGERLPPAVCAVLEGAGSLELLALHPYPWQGEGQPLNPGEDFHGYKVLGRTQLEDDARQRELVVLIYRGLLESRGMVAACFNPRHGLRAQRGGSTVDLVICYECLSMQVHLDGVVQDDVLTADSVGPAVTAFFRAEGLPVHSGE